MFKLNGILGKHALSIEQLILKEAQKVNLKAVQSIEASYDPFDERSYSTRKFLTYLFREDVLYTNPGFNNIQTTIKCDRSEPTVAFKLVTGKNVILKAGNLSAQEMFEMYNKHVNPAAPVEEKPRETLTTKAMKRQSRL